jgi:hypothetical protein
MKGPGWHWEDCSLDGAVPWRFLNERQNCQELCEAAIATLLGLVGRVAFQTMHIWMVPDYSCVLLT